MAAPITINVGGRLFTTLESTLARSSFFNALFSPQWAQSITRLDGVPFVDRSPVLFEHILDFLRSGVPPIFWSRTNAFDFPRYAVLLREAEYFQVDPLAEWIRTKQYLYTIRITPSVDLELLNNCRQGLTWHSADIEKHFDDGTVSTSSNSGKSTTLWKRVHVQRTELHSPVGHRASISI